MVSQRCPRCNGNLFMEVDLKWQINCLQCGYTKELDAKVTPEHRKLFGIEVPSTESPSIVRFRTAKSSTRIKEE